MDPKPSIQPQFLLIFLILALALVAVTWPRFDRQDLFIGAYTHDQNVDTEAYALMAREFRNPPDWQLFIRPFCFRPLTPLIASLLPVRPHTAINLVNLGWLLAALYFLLRTLQDEGFTPPWQAAGGAMLVFAFPTFYYSTIGLVDPGILFVCALGARYLNQGRIMATIVLAILGMLLMEKAVLLVPALFGALLARGRSWGAAGLTAFGTLVACFVVLSLIQQFGPVYKGDSYFWDPQLEVLLHNLRRFEFWAGSVLSFGLPGILLIVWLTRTFRRMDNPWALDNWRPWLINLCGTLGGIGLWGWAVISAHGDGRSLWLVYPFLIPLAVHALREIVSRHLPLPATGEGSRNPSAPAA